MLQNKSLCGVIAAVVLTVTGCAGQAMPATPASTPAPRATTAAQATFIEFYSGT